MATLQFYYNYASRKSERTRYIDDTTLWQEPLKIQVMSSDYIFEENHQNSDIAQWVITQGDLENVNNYIRPNTDLHTVELKNTDLPLGYDDVGKIIGSIIISTQAKPICIIRSLEDFPLEVYGQYLTLNFATSFAKTFSFNEFIAEVGNTIIHQHYKNSIIQPVNDLSRTSSSVSVGELMDKTSLSGKSSAYKDLSLTGKAHPLTGDIVTVSGASAINQSLRTIVLANTYDRPFSSKDIAGNVNAFLFEFADDITNNELKTGIAVAINNNEPRINLIDILSVNLPEQYSIQVSIIYSIKTTNSTQEFSIILDRA